MQSTAMIVAKTDNARIHARAAGDVATLSRIYADDYVLITAEGDVRSKQDQIDELKSGKLRFAPLVPTERTVRMFGEVALVTSRDPAGIVRNGQEIGGDLRMVRVYVRRLGRWQLVSAQATRVQLPH
jgi:ketosteroid isomerase-like protein